MTHEQIEQQDILDRYLLEKLSPEQREQFEEHYLECPECAEWLEASCEWITGVRDALTEDSSTRAARRSFLPLPTWGLVAGVVAIGLVTLVRRPATHPVEVTQQPPAQTRRAMPTVELRSFRSARPADASLTTAAAANPFTVRLDARGLNSFSAYSVNIVDDSGRTVWSADAVTGSGDEWLEVNVQSAALVPGGYWVRVSGVASGARPELLREYSLVIGP